MTKRAGIHSRNDLIFNMVNGTILSMILLIVLFPLIYTLSASFSDPKMVTAGKLYFLPVGFNLDSYREVFKNQDIMIGYRNTLIITLTGTLLNMILTVCGAYPLSRKDFYGRNVLMKLFSFTMFFGGGIIPLFLVVQSLGLLNSWASLILPSAVSTYNLIIMRTYFENSVPYELQEAAYMDGCSNTGILFKVVLPLSGPVLAVLSLYYAVGYWNSYFSAMMYINDRSKYPLQLFLREVLVMNQAQNMMDSSAEEMARQAMRAETIKYSVIVVSSVPMLILYPFVQKFFVKGVMIGALKG
ncbi:carbohydrate ABC transporter permease [Eubacteriales bacterium mix99]|jgi:putative aldouronate transport system permease protein